MGLHQDFRFTVDSTSTVQELLRSLGNVATLNEHAAEFFVFSQLPGQPEFLLDCEIRSGGIRSDRSGAYFQFLGIFLEALTGHFGAVTVEDA